MIKQSKISLRKGVKNDLPTNAPLGEPLFCMDTGEMYVGMGEDSPIKQVVDTEVKSQLEQNVQQLQYLAEKDGGENKPLDFSILRGSVNAVNNGGSAIQDNLTTFNGYQYGVWVDAESKCFVGKRKLPNGKWYLFKLSDNGVLFRQNVKKDGHNIFSIAVDKNGYIHIAGDMHVDDLNYVVSQYPENINSWVKSKMTDDDGSQITYPTFVKRKDGELLFFYRDGGSGNGNTSVNLYDSSSKKWSKLHKNLIDGKTTMECPYLNHISVSENGDIHISGTFRTTATGSNTDIFYIKSKDGGLTWVKSTGETYVIPITHSSIEIAHATNGQNGLLNQNGMECDINNNPHITYFKLDENNYTNIYHLYNLGDGWVNEKVTDFTFKIEPSLVVYQGELSRPSIFCYKERTFIIYRHNCNDKQGGLRIKEVTPNSNGTECKIIDYDLGIFDATFDTQALYTRNELHILIVPTTAEINDQITDLTRWDSYGNLFGGVLSIDLKQIDKVLKSQVKIPSVKIIRDLDIEGVSINEDIGISKTLYLNRKIIITNNYKRLLVKAIARAKGYNDTEVLIKLHETSFNPVRTNTFASIKFPNVDTTYIKDTIFTRLPVNDGDFYLQPEITLNNVNNNTLGRSVIDSINIIIAELDI